jgi:hypothetical protein
MKSMALFAIIVGSCMMVLALTLYILFIIGWTNKVAIIKKEGKK